MTYTRHRVFIGGISAEVSKDEIEKELGKYGKLNSVWVAQNPPGFAFVEFDHGNDADEAVRCLNGQSLFDDGNKLRVEHSRPKQGGGGGRSGRDGGFRSSNRPFYSSRGQSDRPGGFRSAGNGSEYSRPSGGDRSNGAMRDSTGSSYRSRSPGRQRERTWRNDRA